MRLTSWRRRPGAAPGLRGSGRGSQAVGSRCPCCLGSRQARSGGGSRSSQVPIPCPLRPCRSVSLNLNCGIRDLCRDSSSVTAPDLSSKARAPRDDSASCTRDFGRAVGRTVMAKGAIREAWPPARRELQSDHLLRDGHLLRAPPTPTPPGSSLFFNTFSDLMKVKLTPR